MNYIYLFILIVMMNSCVESISYKESLADSVMGQFKGVMKKEENMVAYGTGGAMMHEIKKFFFAYQCPKAVTVEEARGIVVRSITCFFDIVNRNEEIRPFLISYPFPVSGLEMDLAFLPKEPDDDKQFVYKIFIQNGKISYQKYDPQASWGSPLFNETYEEALLKVGNGC